MRKCPQCEAELPDQARFCPNCGAPVQVGPTDERPSSIQAQLSGAGAIAQGDGAVAASEESVAVGGDVHGDVSVGGTLNQIVRGDLVERQVIANVIVTGGRDALETLAHGLASLQGVDQRAVRDLVAQPIPERADRQIAEVVAAQREAEARGVGLTPQAAYQLGKLAAHRRDYDAALDYFHRAAQEDPDFSDAFEAIAWLQQIRATHDLRRRDYDAAIGKLGQARSAIEHADPLDPQALALRGYIFKTLAQVAEATQNRGERREYYQEAARLFEHVVRLDPEDASAQNGLGNVRYALGDLDAAIAAYERAIELAPGYTAAYHDLALAYEGRMEADEPHAAEWCERALQAWRQVYRLAPNDPTFSAQDVLAIGQRIAWLERRCGQGDA